VKFFCNFSKQPFYKWSSGPSEGLSSWRLAVTNNYVLWIQILTKNVTHLCRFYWRFDLERHSQPAVGRETERQKAASTKNKFWKNLTKINSGRTKEMAWEWPGWMADSWTWTSVRGWTSTKDDDDDNDDDDDEAFAETDDKATEEDFVIWFIGIRLCILRPNEITTYAWWPKKAVIEQKVLKHANQIRCCRSKQNAGTAI